MSVDAEQGGLVMDTATIETTIKACLVRIRLEQAANVTRAAHTCRDIGNLKKSFEIAFDIERRPIRQACS
jgi:hypothetical protein